MTILLVLLTTICTVALIKIFHGLYKFYKYSAIINKIPGPKGYPLIGNVLTILRIPREDRHEWHRDLCKQYDGGILRMWHVTTATVSLMTAENISPILSSKTLITKSLVYDFIRPWLGQGLLTSTGELWHRQRKLITPTFNINILMGFAIVMSKKAEILKGIISSTLKENPNEPINVSVLLTRCALDIICESAMGININTQMNHHSEYSEALHSITSLTLERAFRPWLYNDWIYYRSAQGKKFKHAVETSKKFTNKVISERKSARKTLQHNREHSDKDTEFDKPRRQAFLDHLLDACEREDMLLTDEELREQVDTFLFAGHDTTATAIGWALFCISNNPNVEEKIHEEQLLVFGDSTEPAKFEQISELKYLEMVINESLRLFPSAPSLSRTVTEDVEIAGYKIPKGCIALIQIQEVHWDPKHWPNPEKFDPDRFLPENSVRRHPYAFVPFSAGPRNCIGKKFSLFEQKIVLTALLRKWRVKSLIKFKEVKFHNELILRPQNGIKIYFTPK